MSKPPRSATVVITQRVRPERVAAYETWQAGINGAAAEFAGFQGAQVVAPVPGVQDEWVVLYRFDSAARLEAWLASPERAAWLERGAGLFAERSVLQTVATAPTEEVVTVVASHRVHAGKEDEYKRWQADIDAAAARFPGFVSTEVFAPVPGVQPESVVVFRFASADALEGWLASPERAELLRRAEPLIAETHLARVGGGLGGWFPIGPSPHPGKRVAPRWKQGMAVLLALYPTVMLLRWAEAPVLEPVPEAVRVFLANLTSVAVLTWLAMPLVTRTLARWLAPDAGPRLSMSYAAGLCAVYAAMVAGFWRIF